MRSFQSPESEPSALVRPASPWFAAVAAVIVALAGAGLRASLGERIGDHGVFLVFVPAVVVGAAMGGWMSGAIFDATGSYRAAFGNGIAWNLLNVGLVTFLLLRAKRLGLFVRPLRLA